MGAHMLNDTNHKLKEREGRYCKVCNPSGQLCPSTWENRSTHIQNDAMEEEEEEEEREPEESDWNADLEKAQDYCARVSESHEEAKAATKGVNVPTV